MLKPFLHWQNQWLFLMSQLEYKEKTYKDEDACQCIITYLACANQPIYENFQQQWT